MPIQGQAETYPLETADLSEGGVCFVSKRQLPLQSLVDVLIILPGDRKVAFAGRVVQTTERGDDRWETALAILDIGSRDGSDLVRFLRDRALGTEEATGGDEPSTESR